MIQVVDTPVPCTADGPVTIRRPFVGRRAYVLAAAPAGAGERA